MGTFERHSIQEGSELASIFGRPDVSETGGICHKYLTDLVQKCTGAPLPELRRTRILHKRGLRNWEV